MITILPSGRLGNHLFQYAFGLSIAARLKTDFIFNTSEISDFFELRHYNNPVRKKIRTLRYMVSLKFNKYTPIDLNKDIPPSEIMARVSNKKILYGYFQSPLFFAGYEDKIRKEFTIKTSLRNGFQSAYGHLFQKEVVCLAVRMTDYLTWKIDEIDGNTPELNIDYFKKALTHIPDLESKNIIIISDDVETVKRLINFRTATYIEPSADQFIALTLADHIIISNSTFQWWGAWLNKKPGKVVYAPKYWMGHKVKREYPKEIIPADWIQVEV